MGRAGDPANVQHKTGLRWLLEKWGPGSWVWRLTLRCRCSGSSFGRWAGPTDGGPAVDQPAGVVTGCCAFVAAVQNWRTARPERPLVVLARCLGRGCRRPGGALGRARSESCAAAQAGRERYLLGSTG